MTVYLLAQGFCEGLPDSVGVEFGEAGGVGRACQWAEFVVARCAGEMRRDELVRAGRMAGGGVDRPSCDVDFEIGSRDWSGEERAGAGEQADDGRAHGHDRVHDIGATARDFASDNPAEAPADEPYGLLGVLGEFLDLLAAGDDVAIIPPVSGG